MTRARFLILVATACSFFALPASADQSSEDWIRRKHSKLTRQLKKGDKSADQRKKIERTMDRIFDYDTIAKDSMSKYWGDLTEEQRKTFSELLTKLVRRAYRKNVNKTLLNYKVSFEGTEKGKKGVVVRTIAKSTKDAREEPVSVDYVVHTVKGKKRVRDVSTEGSSMVRGYRSQFRRIMKKKGFDDLIARMKKKLAKG